MSTSEIAKTIRRFLVLSIRLSYQSVCNHPVLISFSLLLILLYQLFPSLFSFFLSTSPVLVCTTLLLGTILSFGQPNIPQIEDEEEERTINTDQISLCSASEAADNIIFKHSEISAVQNICKDQKPDITKRELEEVSFTKQAVTFSPKSDTLPEDTIQERESVNSDERSLSFEREVGESSLVYSSNLALEESVDSPRWQRIDSHDASSGFESDGSESSSPDASMTDIIPLLEEIDPLLDPDSPTQLIQNPKDDSDSSSQASSHDLLQVEIADEEEEEDKSAKKGDESHENAFTWTADDQKNLMDLGYSEVERNRRLENLMARRRSRKNIRFELDQNLINLDGNTTGSSTIGTAIDDLSQFRVRVPHVTVSRENPFDSSFDDNPVPGSAPSVLVPRRNPFDEPYEEPTESMILSHESWSPRQYMSASHRDMFFTRHDSFNYSSGEFRQERHFSRFKPFIASDYGTDPIGEGSSSNGGTFERQFSGNSGSKSSSPLETDSSFHVVDIVGSNPARHDEEMDEDEGSISSDDISSVAVQLDNNEFESNGGRESPSIHSDYFSSSEKVRLVDAVPDLLVWDDVAAQDSPGASSSSQPPLSELDSAPRDFGDICKSVEPNTTPLASQHITNPSQENTIITSQFSLMDLHLHPIPEEETTEDRNPDKTNLGLLGPLESDQDSDEDADQIYPEPVEYNEIDEDLLTELDAVGDFAPRQHISHLEFQNTVIESNQQFGGPLNTGIEPGVGLVLVPSENPEQTVYNPRWHILQSTFTEDINALLDEISDESHESPVTGVKAKQSGEQEQPDMVLLGSEVAESETPGIVEETESRMLAVKAKYLADLEPAFVQVATALAGGEDTGVVEETESGMLVVKAKSVVDINMAFEQAREALGGSTGTQSGDAEMGMAVLEAKSSDDIESAIMQISELSASENVGLVDETESGTLVVKASSKEDIDLVFRQVGEVIGKPDKVGVNAGCAEDANSDMLVLDAKSIKDIDSVMLNVSEVFEGSSYVDSVDSGLVDETDSGMLVVKAKSVADIDSVFKQVGVILRIPVVESGNAGTSQNAGGSENGMVVLDASSLDDIDSAILNASEANGSGDAGLVDETESGMLVVKANSLADINSTFKLVGEVLGKSDTGSESPKLVEEANSGIMVLNARSIEDIYSAVMQVTEITGTGDSGVVDETESGMLVVKASSLADIDSVFQQVGEALGNTNAESKNLGIVEDSHSGMLIINAKSVNDIESAMLQVSEAPGNTETGLVDETDSGMLVVKASSVVDINSVFLQVGEILGKQNAGSDNPGIIEDSDSGMLVLDAKSVEDIGSAMLHVSDTCRDGVEETESGMLVLKAKSLEDIDSVLKQVGEVVNKSSGSGIPELVEETEYGMLVVNAKSLEDINLATQQVSSLTEVGDSKVVTQLPVVNGSNMEKE